jgi:hypothetical protein
MMMMCAERLISAKAVNAVAQESHVISATSTANNGMRLFRTSLLAIVSSTMYEELKKHPQVMAAGSYRSIMEEYIQV